MKLMGFVLVAIAILTLALGGIGSNRQRTVMDQGPFQAMATQHYAMRLPPLAGVIALVGGIVLVAFPRRRPDGA